MRKQVLAGVLLVTGSGVVAMAQEGSVAGQEEELAVLPQFAAIDANKDGMIDSTEAEMLTEELQKQHQIEFRFETVDKNSDGLINGGEYVAYDKALKERLGIA